MERYRSSILAGDGDLTGVSSRLYYYHGAVAGGTLEIHACSFEV